MPPSGFPQLLISPIESPSSLFFLFYHCCLFTCEEIPSIPPTEHNFRSPTGSSIDLISLSRRSLVPSTRAPLPNFRLQARNTRGKKGTAKNSRPANRESGHSPKIGCCTYRAVHHVTDGTPEVHRPIHHDRHIGVGRPELGGTLPVILRHERSVSLAPKTGLGHVSRFRVHFSARGGTSLRHGERQNKDAQGSHCRH